MTDAFTSTGTTYQNNQTGNICNNINENCVSQNTNSLDHRNKSDTIISTKLMEGDHLCLHAETCINGTLNQNDGPVNQLKEETMTKYVNKKGDVKASEKLKGHFKNSLKRRKRSFNRNSEDNGNTNEPGIYDVIKAQNIERGELNLPKLDAREIIKNSDIADFNIETLHKSDKPDQNKFQKGDNRFFSSINNNQHFPSSIEKDANNENLSYQDDKYGTFDEQDEIHDDISHENQRGQNPTSQAQRHRYLSNTDRKHYLPKTRELNHENEETNIKEDKTQESSSNQDENDDRSNENYQRGERINQNVEAPNNILSRGNIRYYKDRKNKYHISKPKKLNDESTEDVSLENINENSSSLEEDDYNHDEKFKEVKKLDVNRKLPKPILQSRQQEYHDDNVKRTDNDNFSYQEGKDDETPDENLRGQNERYYDNNKSHLPASRKPDDYSDKTNKREDTENQYDNDEDTDKSLGKFKKDKHTTDDIILERHNQKYNEDRNKYLSGLKDLDEDDDENYDKEDDYSKENFKNDRDLYSQPQPPNNVLQKSNEPYFNDKNNKYQQLGSAKLVNNNNERQDKENQDNEDIDESTESSKNRLINENKERNNLLQPRNQLYYSKNNKRPSLESKKSNEESSENYDEHSREPVKNYSRDEGLLKITEETPSQSYRSIDFERENSKENNSGIKYANQPINNYSGNTGRPDIRTKPNFDSGKQQLSTNDGSIPGNTNIDRMFKENFGDNRQKETEILNGDYEKSPKIQETPYNAKITPEVDFSDFSYDRFRGVSDAEKLEPAKDSYENYETDSLAITSTSKPKTKKKIKSKTGKIKKPKTFTKQDHINRGRVKPVIELNNEGSSEERQKNSNENLSGNFKTTIPKRKANVKQQFERIPSNYNHASSKKTNNDPPGESFESEGTLDTISPLSNKYDEHLNNKFGDVGIKLPEINLPEDILVYAQQARGNSKDKLKTNNVKYPNDDNAQYSKTPLPQGNPENVYHHYDPPDTAQYSEQPKSKGEKPAEDYDFFASYINKPNEGSNVDDENSKSDIEDGEDLYERFVRERFGKKDSYKEKSGKIQEKNSQENKPRTKNKELHENIQKAIKKAEKVQKEAEKSKDPKASYLWTLEYGEKL
ncbi:uncharacterized protein DDB_G0283697-like [Maniola hyperantus]|uniref:uncharacterized protein DDB_G0283697-like n=1 Tax=Aphantopus hyperantus TaxID=2795564 RepID=UPI001567D4F8|nr:putative uncharacterized protein DDB_G0282133 [Maniola hyperantus]